MKYKRILLKLSGESLMGDSEYGIDPKMLNQYALEYQEDNDTDGIGDNCDNCLEIKQIDSLIQTIVGCVGGVDTENERYIDSFDKSCVQEIISNQILYKKNKLDNNILKKISNLYLHEAISVLSIYYYHSYYKLFDTKLSNDK